jgi:hypothetical protein
MALISMAGNRNAGRGVFPKGHSGALAACVVTAFLSSCGSSDMFEPIGIGPERDDLKQSPCACIELPQTYVGWLRG